MIASDEDRRIHHGATKITSRCGATKGGKNIDQRDREKEKVEKKNEEIRCGNDDDEEGCHVDCFIAVHGSNGSGIETQLGVT